MRVRLLVFGSLTDALASGREVELTEGTTVRDLRAWLSKEHPEAGVVLAASMVAVNHAFAAEEQLLRAGDEVAVIPPVSGG